MTFSFIIRRDLDLPIRTFSKISMALCSFKTEIFEAIAFMICQVWYCPSFGKRWHQKQKREKCPFKKIFFFRKWQTYLKVDGMIQLRYCQSTLRKTLFLQIAYFHVNKEIDFNEDDDWLDNLKMEKKLIKVKKLPKLILEVLEPSKIDWRQLISIGSWTSWNPMKNS